jgi:hypothetical protein
MFPRRTLPANNFYVVEILLGNDFHAITEKNGRGLPAKVMMLMKLK